MKALKTHLLLAAATVVAGSALLLPSAAFASGDLNEASCPNEARTGFSAELPDCRAFEMVSPVVKNGDYVGLIGILAGDERVAAESIGVLANATSDPDCPTTDYNIARTEGGWETSAVDDAPLGAFTYATEQCARMLTNGEGDNVLLLRAPSQSVFARSLYIQHPGREPELIGPMLPPTADPGSPTGSGQAGFSGYVLADPSLSHILFTTQAFEPDERWPDDTTSVALGRGFSNVSLYEYAGTGNTVPTLVGVGNTGKEPISDCATTPGGGARLGNQRNAISTSGKTVFFTSTGLGDPEAPECERAAHFPPVNELFARVNGGQPQSPVGAEGECTDPADACTVAISEPKALSAGASDPGCTTEACRKDIAETANFRDANYEGASVDGSKVFFTSTQSLTNQSHEDVNPDDSAARRNTEKGCAEATGAGGCNLYEYDFDLNPETKRPIGLVLLSGGDSSGLGPEVQGVGAISDDGSHVYFVAKGDLTGTQANVYGETAHADEDNLYTFNTVTRSTSYVATLSAADANQWSSNSPLPMDVSANGRYLVFTSSAALTPGDGSHFAQVFRYDSETGELVRVSTGEAGADRSGVGALSSAGISRAVPGLESEQGLGMPDGDPHPAVAENGTVVFASSDALTAQARANVCVEEENGKCIEYAWNIYEYENGQLSLIDRAVSANVEISLSGRDIFFESSERLAPPDPDTITDIYDARIEGGFNAVGSTSVCQGEACQGTPVVPPSLTAPGSATLAAPGSPPASSGGSAPTSARPKALTRAQKLAKALDACKKQRKAKRKACEAQAKKRYGAAHKSKRSAKGRK